ncbi:arginine transporter [uncultured Limimaricola sp.]|uniref:arginine transporter n=1 Tax=uncultured Limimaricola sp. TaxID=2211667 RepID=UPI0030F98D42
MRITFSIIALTALAACGGGQPSGAISRACEASGRPGANASLCSCVQGAADATLSGSEQRRAAKFFKDPQKAQDTRQGDGTSAFWNRYKAFADRAEAICR